MQSKTEETIEEFLNANEEEAFEPTRDYIKLIELRMIASKMKAIKDIIILCEETLKSCNWEESWKSNCEESR
ncbi:MAG: hypothetical protein U9N33_02785 [Campylobacterota bacterium]|nr:hypothetical protein [Campylobacterota bacterium]